MAANNTIKLIVGLGNVGAKYDHSPYYGGYGHT